ncbi:Zn-ribbon domain-containing OB-fold protein [Halorhabdus rudnickae]|uniref:Zn-ribbon domain-containing OB-fold protein n=1 Tax=Halorhabdus rudnickae TaxID=1775544 RepID=UPI001082FD4E|nr:OB-fold domain-containing protein [Halorhabdus rudnickae]
MSDDEVRDDGYDDFMDALAEGEPYYVECANGHASLPPRRLCPECASEDLDEASLPETGELLTYNVTHVPTPAFEDDVPFVLGIAEFGDVRLTGQVRADSEDVEVGESVSIGTDVSETNGERYIAFDLA